MSTVEGWGGLLLCLLGFLFLGGSLSHASNSREAGAGPASLIFGVLLGMPLIAGGASLIRKSRESIEREGEQKDE